MGEMKSLIGSLAHKDKNGEYSNLSDRYKALREKVEKVRETYYKTNDCLPSKTLLGKQIQKLNAEISLVKQQIKDANEKLAGPFDVHLLNSHFRGAAGTVLSKRIYGSILDQATCKMRDTSFELKLIDLLTEEEHNLIESAKILKEENTKLKKSLMACKKAISDSMPNFIGNLDPVEYKKRLELTKLLTAINKTIN